MERWIVFASCTTAVCSLTFLSTLFFLFRLENKVSEAQDAIDAVSVQLGKAKDELVSKITDLEGQVAAGETPDLTALKAAAQALDDVVPDAEPSPPSE